MNRFFVDRSAITGGEAKITGEDVKHISRVLRMRPGDQLMLSDGAGGEYLCRIAGIEADSVQLLLLDMFRSAAEPPYGLTLVQGLPKAGKMETIIQKCVELGACSFIPVRSQRTVVLLDEREFEKKRLRYGRVAEEAAKQSRRGVIPRVESLAMGFQGVDWSRFDLILLADEEERNRGLKSILKGLPAMPQSIAAVIGPEGGLAREEVALIRAAGGLAFTLGNRILRTETAGMALLSMLQYELEG